MNRLKFSLIFLLLTVFLSQTVLAITTDDVISYYKFDGAITDSYASYDWTNDGTADTTNGIINNGRTFDGSDDELSSTSYDWSGLTAWSINMWIDPDTLDANARNYFMYYIDGNNYFQILNLNGGIRLLAKRLGSLYLNWYPDTGTFTTGSYQMLTVTWDGTNFKIYADGTYINGATTSYWLEDLATGGTTFIGTPTDTASATSRYDGDIDELSMYDSALTTNNITDLYASGSGLQYPFSVAATFEITVSNQNTFNVSLSSVCSGASSFYSTTTGTIDTGISEDCVYSASFTIRATNYFEKNYTDYNVSNDLTTTLNKYAKIQAVNSYDDTLIKNFSISFDGSTFEPLTHPTLEDGYLYTSKTGTFNFTIFHDEYITSKVEKSISYNQTINFSLHQAEANITVFEKVTNNQIYNFTVSDGVVSDSTTNGTAYLNLNGGNITFTFSNNISYYNISYKHFINNGSNQAFNTSFYNHKLTVAAKDYFTNASLNNLIINISSGTFKENYNISGSSIVLNLTNGLNYTIVVNPSEYASNTSNISLTGLNSTHTVYLFKENSLYVRVYDEEQNKLLNWKTVNIEVIGDSLAVENSTSSGALIVEPLVQGDYRIRTSAVDYFERLYFATVSDDSTQTIDVYLLNSSSSTNMTVTIKDEKADFVSGAYVKLLRYYLDCNCYKTVEIGQTNFNGETGLRVVFNDELYKFIVEYNSIVYLQTTPFKITSDSLTFTIRIDELDPTINLRKKQDLIYNLSFNSNTNNFVYTFSDTNNAVLNGCLKVYKTTVRSDTLYNSTCVESTGATIIINVAAVNGTTYKAVSSIYFNEEPTTLEILFKSFGSGSEVFGLMGVFATIILVIIFGFIGKWSPSVSIVLVVFSVVISRLMGLIQLGITPLMGLIGIGVIIALINRA